VDYNYEPNVRKGMNQGAIPGFAAEVSLYESSGRYHVGKSLDRTSPWQSGWRWTSGPLNYQTLRRREEERRLILYEGKKLHEWVPEAVDRIVEHLDPMKVILFGSLVRGEGGHDSDIDLLVLFEHVEWDDMRTLATDIGRALLGIPVPMDIVVTDPVKSSRPDVEPRSVLRFALCEGKVLYERPSERVDEVSDEVSDEGWLKDNDSRREDEEDTDP
jgi:uncharacterized protein